MKGRIQLFGPPLTLLWLLGLFNFSGCGGDPTLIDTVATPVAAAVAKIKIADEYYNRKVRLKTTMFYRANEYHRGWLRKGRPDKMFKAFVEEVKASERYGFVPADYHIDELEAAADSLYDTRKRKEADLSSLDLRITASFFLFTTHLLEGRIRYPGAREFLWKRGMPLENDIAVLLNMQSPSDLKKGLENLHPKDPQYKRLQKSLAEYRKLAPADTFPSISPDITVSLGKEHDAIPTVRKKLGLTDMKNSRDAESKVYDEGLQNAVKKFQERHGLEPDGILAAETIRALNLTIKEKADVISLNLERLRWLPHLRGEGDEIVVNVPEYMLRVYKNNREKMKMRVVLGAEFTPTPVFHDTLKYIVFSPTWMVPKSIFEKEFLPKLQEYPGHFDPERFTIYKNGKEVDPFLEPWSDEELEPGDYRVVENPGVENSLGRVKFIMPNDFSIYLHDTPANKHFVRNDRALSHGCIRLEHPDEFALYLLSDQPEWDEDKVTKAMASEQPVQVNLKRPFPVYIVYRTAWVDDDGQIQFRSDIYGHDKRHRARLADNS